MADAVGTGIDVLLDESCERLRGRRIGLVANQASVTSDLRHTSGALIAAGIDLACLFGPQHGLGGETQANMIEWEDYIHPVLGIPVHSLYGERREPTDGMLEGLDALVIDLPDVGARPYTYLWTSLLAMRRCARIGLGVLVLDRPNPIGGTAVEGPALDREYASFVGLHPVAMRHGMTIGEALGMIARREGLSCAVEVVPLRGWKRPMHFEDTGLPWVLPSPNIPTPQTALLYPGMVMLEGTSLSEGRGTTRPFEIIGAPGIEPEGFARELAAHRLDGIIVRPCSFAPTWDKYAGRLCGGVQIHIVDRRAVRPVRCAAAVIETAARCYPEIFRWLDPPYEYEFERRPIDIITGGPHLRETIDGAGEMAGLLERWDREAEAFRGEREPFLLYGSADTDR